MKSWAELWGSLIHVFYRCVLVDVVNVFIANNVTSEVHAQLI